MTFGTRFEQGEILIIPFPFSDLSAVKQRPVLVLSKENKGDDLVTCGITSNLRDAQHSVLIDNEHLVKGKIPVTSRIKVDKIFTVEKSVVKKRIAKVDVRTFQKVRNELFSLI